MKLRFLIPFFALFFLLSCGDDPVSPEAENDNQSHGQEEGGKVVPDDENSDNENGNGGKSDSEHGSETCDDCDEDDEDVFEPEETDNTADDSDTAADADADPADSGDDQDTAPEQDDADSEFDDDDDSDTGDNDADTESGDDDTDPGSDTGEEDELEVVLPYNGGKVYKTIKLNTAINKIDVLFLVDLYSSISAAHQNLKDNVKTAIVDEITSKIPDSAFGLVEFGTFEQDVFVLEQAVTTDRNLVGTKFKNIVSGTKGSRVYHNFALWEAAAGIADYEQIAYKNSIGETSYMSINVPAVDCTGQEGSIGGGCFRENAMPVFVMASSRKFNDMTYDNFGEWKQGTKKTRPIAAAEMNGIYAKFLGVTLTTTSTTNPKDDFKYIAEQTKSQTMSNENFNIAVSHNDETLSTQIADAIKNLTDNIKLNVKAVFTHNENEYGVENTTAFVKSWDPGMSNDNYMKAGDTASFDITFENTIHENNDCEPHIFYITVEAKGEGMVLDSRKIKVIVPGKECSEPLR